jgi:glutathione-specific gamma-glutamylcyclotransferase
MALLPSAEKASTISDHVRSDDEIAGSLRSTLTQRPDMSDVWIFGYGSLIWNPGIDFAEKRPALLRGWHRRFCLSSTTARGSIERPGMMLALARGGSCRGLAFRLEESKLEAELLNLWRREMPKDTYRPRWLSARSNLGPISILTFVGNKYHPRYIENISEEQTAHRIAYSHGEFGSGVDYLTRTIEGLDNIGVNDGYLERIKCKIERMPKPSDMHP